MGFCGWGVAGGLWGELHISLLLLLMLPLLRHLTPACVCTTTPSQSHTHYHLFKTQYAAPTTTSAAAHTLRRAAKIHFLIMGHLRKQMPYFGQKKAQEKLLDNLGAEFAHVQREYHLHPGGRVCVLGYWAGVWVMIGSWVCAWAQCAVGALPAHGWVVGWVAAAGAR